MSEVLSTTKFETINEIVDDLLRILDDNDKQALLSLYVPTNGRQFGTSLDFGRFIRNHYRLWHTHPLTKRWREDPDSRQYIILNDVEFDTSPDHPEQVSEDIKHALFNRLRSLA